MFRARRLLLCREEMYGANASWSFVRPGYASTQLTNGAPESGPGWTCSPAARAIRACDGSGANPAGTRKESCLRRRRKKLLAASPPDGFRMKLVRSGFSIFLRARLLRAVLLVAGPVHRSLRS